MCVCSIPLHSGHGMVLDRGVIVTDLVENGLALVHGVRQGDEIRQVCIYVYVCMHACVCGCMCVCVPVCLCVYVCACMYVCVYVLLSLFLRVRMFPCPQGCVCGGGGGGDPEMVSNANLLGFTYWQVNNINLCSDRDPLEFASRLLDYAAQNITLTIRRQVGGGAKGNPYTV